MAAVLHRKFAINALCFIRTNGSVLSTDFRLLRGAKNYKVNNGDADEIDTTTHDSLANLKESIMGLRAQGEFSADVKLNFNTSASAVTGENLLNGLQVSLFNSQGTDDEYEIVLTLAKTTSITALPATPPTDRTYLTFTAKVKSFPVEAPHDADHETTITFLLTSKAVLTTTV